MIPDRRRYWTIQSSGRSSFSASTSVSSRRWVVPDFIVAVLLAKSILKHIIGAFVDVMAGATHMLHHFIVKQPFYLRQITAFRVLPIMKQMVRRPFVENSR